MTLKLTRAQSKHISWQEQEARNYYPVENEFFKGCLLYTARISDKLTTFFTNKMFEEIGYSYSGSTFKGIKYHQAIHKQGRINFISGNVTVGIMCHEIAHYEEIEETGKSGHSNHFLNRVVDVMNRFVELARRENMFNNLDAEPNIPEKITLESYFQGDQRG